MLNALPVADITIEEMDAEEVIRQLFQQREASRAAERAG